MIRSYDVAIIGAGPVGSACALAHARNGARVALLEANPKLSSRFAGEWLHPPAVRILQNLGVDLEAQCQTDTGKGFAIFPEDGSEAITFPYPDGVHGFVCEHSSLVERLRQAVRGKSNIEFLVGARASEVGDDHIGYTQDGDHATIDAARIVGADGQASIVRQSLGLSVAPKICSQTVGMILNDVELPLEGYGHVLLGGPGPVLVYRLAGGEVRLIADIPLDRATPRDRAGFLQDSYTGLLPDALRPSFVEALQSRRFQIAVNKLSPHVTYGSPDRILIGDAAGHYHPMTAMGMTFGFGDAFSLAENENFENFVANRFRETHTPSFLSMGLYEVFADHRLEAVAVRHAIYLKARTNSVFRDRTIRLLACEDISPVRMGIAFFSTVGRAVMSQVPISLDRLAWRRSRDILHAMAVRIWWLIKSMRHLYRIKRKGMDMDEQAWNMLSGAFQLSMPLQSRASMSGRPKDGPSTDASAALKSATDRLISMQNQDGSWEGEMVWCPMLTAQYVLLHYITGMPLEPTRRRNVLRSFEHTRLENGAWGLHEHSEPHLFVTTSVYVAARLLETRPDDPLLESAREFLHAEGVVNIPSWGKFWLALLNLYDWRGVNAILPELWALPHWLPIHPSNWYCHTRLIYMAMSVIYSRRFQTSVTPVIESLREELFPGGFTNVDFSAARNRLRERDLFARPGIGLRIGYGLTRIFERYRHKGLRSRCLDEIVQRVRWELQTTRHTSISPVSGILNLLALWLQDPNDADFRKGLEQLEGWIWEDDIRGARVTGARSASWDSGFALQALTTVSDLDGVRNSARAGAGFLSGQQIRVSFEGFSEAYRNDPKGGWCFAGGWHGWPVTDCTAEAVCGLIGACGRDTDVSMLGEAIRFMLRGQNSDGSFGSYEARRSALGLEWLNPAEMFGESMTEGSYVECTASCLTAFAACKRHFPDLAGETLMEAVMRAGDWLRRTQAADGSWRGVWGVQFIYGTLFGIRGLLAGGACPGDPALRLACHWLVDRQHGDGGWGEHYSGCLGGRYVPHEESQVIQTAWALIALLEAEDPNWDAISMGAQYLLDTQNPDGTWPKQDMVGVFFRTALLDYVLYRQYFPLYALGLYQRRRMRRHLMISSMPNDGTKSADAKASSHSPVMGAGAPPRPPAPE